jgi:hypothetical protein
MRMQPNERVLQCCNGSGSARTARRVDNAIRRTHDVRWRPVSVVVCGPDYVTFAGQKFCTCRNDSSSLQVYSGAVLYVLSAISLPDVYVHEILGNFVTAIKSSTVRVCDFYTLLFD